MKRRHVLLSLLAFIAFLPALEAQQKIAYVDIAAIMKLLPDAQEAQRKLDITVESWQKELEVMEKDWQQKFNDYDKRKLILTDQGRSNAERELQDLDRKIMDFRDKKFGQSGELFTKEDELMRPIQNIVFDQVKLLAVELGYDFIFDKSSSVGLIYGKESLDLTAKAVERITKILPARTLSGQGQQQGQPGQMPPGGNNPGQAPPDPHRPPQPLTPADGAMPEKLPNSETGTPDTRVKTTLKDLAELLRGTFEGDPALELTGVAPIEHAASGALTFLANKKYEHHIAGTAASAIILDRTMSCARADVAIIRVQDPYLSFAHALRFFHPATGRTETVVDPSSSVHPSAVLGGGVYVGALAVLEEGVTVGDDTTVMAGAVLTAGCAIGKGCMLYPNVSILAKARIGDRVIVHAGATIGSDGFGFAPVEKTWEKIPQVGSVEIGDDVEIGANCTIDRGALADTVIGRGTKLDNLIQIAHNVQIGENTVIAAQAGISGSTVIGAHVVLAGQVGVVGHIEIGDDVTVGAQSGVSKSILDAGKVYRGSPAHEIHEELRQEAALRQLPDLIRTVRALEAQVLRLREELDAGRAEVEHH